MGIQPINAGDQHPREAEGYPSARTACRRIRWLAALTALCCCPSTAVLAADVPIATANAELVAFAGAAEYAQRPQVLRHGRHSGEASLRSRSLTYVARKFAQLMIRDLRRSMRDEADTQSRPSTRPQVRSNYDLRLSDDKFVVRMKYRF